MPPKLKMALIGGGPGGFIGRVHATAATLDGRAELVAGALSSDPAKARAAGPDYGIAPDRAYGSYEEMLAAETCRPAGDRIDFVAIATPNDSHYAIARAFVEAGFNVFCDKPMTLDLGQAEELARLVRRTGVVFVVTHNYTGYPLVRQARDMVRAGELGEVNGVRARQLQGTLRKPPEVLRRRPAWKSDPRRAGPSGVFGDVGIHTYHLVRYVTGLPPERLSCILKTFEPGQPFDDYGVAAVAFANGALATIMTSRISHGRDNDLRIEIDGTKASLEWSQEEPNKLWVRVNGQPHRLYTRDPNAGYMSPSAKASCRLPSGHPEGFIEAFANIYTAAYPDLLARAAGRAVQPGDTLYPGVDAGVDGVHFVAQCVESGRQDGAWVPFRVPSP